MNDVKVAGYAGKVLTVDLTKRSFEITDTPQDLIKEYIGGKGFGAKILYDELPAKCDPLSEDNILVIANGPLTGTLAPASARCVIATKSPLTRIWLDSNCGGTFGPELKFAGFDIVKIKGKSESPVYLLIRDEKVEIRDATKLWGKDTLSTEKALKEELSEDYRIACIGQAGEQQVLMAGVQAEGRSFGRGGAGAVFGSKNLKAVAVCGTKGIKIFDFKEFMRANEEAKNEVAINPDTGGSRPKFGTSGIYSFVREAGVLPIKNFQGGTYEGAEDVDEHKIEEELYEQNRGCFACPIACSKYSKVKKGKYKDKFVEGPEYEDVWGFGAQCGNSDLGAIAQAEYLCDYYGIDAVSAGNAIGFLMECYEKGIVTIDEIGFDCAFGNDEAIIEIIHLIGRQEGIGKIIGQGVRKAAEHFGQGSEHFAMHVKGLELPAYDPRGVFGMGLAFATSDRGACHLRAWTVGAEVLNNQNRIDPFSSEFKAELVKNDQDWISVVDSIGICLFATFALGPNQITDLTFSLTGQNAFSSAGNLIKAGERIYNLTRLFNNREGITVKDDSLPPRLLKDPSQQGPAKGQTVPLEEMLSDYYLVRGWDKEGRPSIDKLRELGLMDYVESKS